MTRFNSLIEEFVILLYIKSIYYVCHSVKIRRERHDREFNK